MKIIVAGGRDFDDYEKLCSALAQVVCMSPELEIVHGGAKGADSLAGHWCWRQHVGYRIFLPDWDKHGKRAGPLRNAEMARYAEMLIAFWDGKSRGTHDMIRRALSEGLEVHVYRYGT